MQKLTREQSRAFEVLQSNLEVLEKSIDNCSRLKKKGSLLETDFKAYSTTPFKKTKIPREKHWSWNQSNAKVCVIQPEADGGVITLRKITPRKKYQDRPVPKFKIWLYHISTSNSHFLWCEQGVNAGVITAIGIIFPENVTVESLSFLSIYVNEETAVDLGWSKAGSE